MRRYDVFPIDSYEVYIYKCPECGHEYIKTEKHIKMFNIDICWCGASLYLCIPNKIKDKKEETTINKTYLENTTIKNNIQKPKVLEQNQQTSLLKRSRKDRNEVVSAYISSLKNLGYKKPVALKFIEDLEKSGEDIFNTKEFFDKLIRSIF